MIRTGLRPLGSRAAMAGPPRLVEIKGRAADTQLLPSSFEDRGTNAGELAWARSL